MSVMKLGKNTGMIETNKIPFEKYKAEAVMVVADLFIAMCKMWSKEMGRKKPYMTLDELKALKYDMKQMYYNDKVELLET